VGASQRAWQVLLAALVLATERLPLPFIQRLPLHACAPPRVLVAHPVSTHHSPTPSCLDPLPSTHPMGTHACRNLPLPTPVTACAGLEAAALPDVPTGPARQCRAPGAGNAAPWGCKRWGGRVCEWEGRGGVCASAAQQQLRLVLVAAFHPRDAHGRCTGGPVLCVLRRPTHSPAHSPHLTQPRLPAAVLSSPSWHGKASPHAIILATRQQIVKRAPLPGMWIFSCGDGLHNVVLRDILKTCLDTGETLGALRWLSLNGRGWEGQGRWQAWTETRQTPPHHFPCFTAHPTPCRLMPPHLCLQMR